MKLDLNIEDRLLDKSEIEYNNIDSRWDQDIFVILGESVIFGCKMNKLSSFSLYEIY